MTRLPTTHHALLQALLLVLLASAASSFHVLPPARSLQAFSSSSLHALQHATSIEFPEMDGSGLRVGIIRTRWNGENVDSLTKATEESLMASKVPRSNIFTTAVPGAYELPYAAKLLALSGTVDCIVCIGVLVKGDTMHFEYISDSVAKGIMDVSLITNIPVIFGVLTCNTDQQVLDRSTGVNNHGTSWGRSAVEMALLRKEALGGAKRASLGFNEASPQPPQQIQGKSGAEKAAFEGDNKRQAIGF
jgi:6,7-dimethyl-8-ribityllumazine synthase